MEKIDQLPKLIRSMKAEIRAMERAADAPADEPTRYEIAISSEYAVPRWFGTEILEHSAKAIDLSRADGGLPLLLDHDTRTQVGIVESIRLDKDSVLRGVVRFSRSEQGKAIEQDVADEIRKWISVGYSIEEYSENTKDQTYTMTRWTPLEVSIVPVPADPSVGFDRSGEKMLFPVRSISQPEANQAANQEAIMTTAAPAAPQVEPRNNQDVQVLENAAARAADIVALAQTHGLTERAAEWIKSGRSVDSIAREILDTRAAKPVPAAGFQVDMSQREQKEYSLSRAIMRAAQEKDGTGRLDGFEREIHDEIKRHLPQAYQERGGVFIPLRTRAGLDSKTGGKGLEMVAEQRGDLIELLRNAAMVTRMGATVLPGLTAPVSFPKQTGGMTFHWVGENGGTDVDESEIGTGLATLTPKTVMGATRYSRQLLAQQSIDAEALVRREFAIGHGLAWDLAALHGKGADGQPAGIYVAKGVNSLAMGGAPTFGKLVDMATEVAKDNALMGSTGWLTTPGLAGEMMQTLKASAAGSDMLWTGTFDDGTLAGYAARATNQVRANMGAGTDEHGLVFGNWADLLIGSWGAAELVVDPYTLAGQAMIKVTSFEMWDVLLRHPESFCKATGAKPTA